MVLAVMLLIIFDLFMTLFIYGVTHYTLGWKKPWAVMGSILWPIAVSIWVLGRFLKLVKKDKCEK